MGGDDELAKHTKVRLGGQRVLLGREREFLSLSIFFSSPSLDRFFFCLSFLEENTRTVTDFSSSYYYYYSTTTTTTKKIHRRLKSPATTERNRN
jgi:hypothetical protein